MNATPGFIVQLDVLNVRRLAALVRDQATIDRKDAPC